MNQITKFIIPIAIVIAGGLIAASIYITSKKPQPIAANAGQQVNAFKADVQPVSDADHIRGNKNAKVVILDYSDLECPFCKVFHASLEKIFQEYGPSNQVAWVYRHFPLDIHPKSRKEAEGAECANELGGSDAFWKYVDEIYSITPSNNQLDPSQITTTADKIGLDKTAFTTCLNSGKYAQKIEDSYQAAMKAGGQGTPYTVLLVGGQTIPLVDAQGQGLGALPYTSLKSIIDQMLKS